MPRPALVAALCLAVPSAACCPTEICFDEFILEVPAPLEGDELGGAVDGAAFLCTGTGGAWACDAGIASGTDTLHFDGTPGRVDVALRRGSQVIATDSFEPSYRTEHVGNSFCASCDVARASFAP